MQKYSRKESPQSEARLARSPNRMEPDTAMESALSDRQNAMLQVQRQHGNQYVLRMMAQRASGSSAVQREETDEEQPDSLSSGNSMIGDAAGWLGDMLGVKSIPGKVQQGVDKTRQTVNEGIDWTIDKARGGARKIEDWMDG